MELRFEKPSIFSFGKYFGEEVALNRGDKIVTSGVYFLGGSSEAHVDVIDVHEQRKAHLRPRGGPHGPVTVEIMYPGEKFLPITLSAEKTITVGEDIPHLNNPSPKVEGLWQKYKKVMAANMSPSGPSAQANHDGGMAAARPGARKLESGLWVWPQYMGSETTPIKIGECSPIIFDPYYAFLGHDMRLVPGCFSRKYDNSIDGARWASWAWVTNALTKGDIN